MRGGSSDDYHALLEEAAAAAAPGAVASDADRSADAAELHGAALHAHVALELDALDGVRGVASLVIVAGHLLTFFVPRADASTIYPGAGATPPGGAAWGSPPPLPPPALQHGARWPVFGLEYLSAVSLFFTLSGFTLVQAYERPPRAPGEPPPLSTPAQRNAFLRRRVARLAPLYYLGLAAGAVPFVLYTDPATRRISAPAALLGLQSIVLYQVRCMTRRDTWHVA